MSIKDSFNSALIKSRPYTLDFGFMTDALNFLIYKKVVKRLLKHKDCKQYRNNK